MGIFDNFTGSQSRSDITNAYNNANSAINSGYKTANGYYNQAVQNYNPYTQTGQAANTFYDNALGLNGDAARTSAENTITSDPLFTGALNLQNSNTMAYLNARGSAGGGAAVQAAQNNLYQNYGNVLDRYSALGAQGLQAAGQQSNALMNQGNLGWDYGTTKAGNSIQYGNAMAQTRNMGLNNLLGVLGTGINALNAGSNVYNSLYNGGGAKQQSPYASNALFSVNPNYLRSVGYGG